MDDGGALRILNFLWKIVKLFARMGFLYLMVGGLMYWISVTNDHRNVRKMESVVSPLSIFYCGYLLTIASHWAFERIPSA